MDQVTMQEMLKEYLIKGNVEKIQQPAIDYWAPCLGGSCCSKTAGLDM
jgi:hypothetical protein